MSEPNNTRQYAFSAAPEMLRSNQQDDTYQGLLKSKIIDGLELFMPWLFNYRLISRNEDIVKMLAGLVYYSLTTLRSNQTLGEEYASLAQFNKNQNGLNAKNHPVLTRNRKILFILFATVFPVLSTRVLKKLYNNLQQKLYERLHNDSFLKILLKNMPDFDSIVQKVFKLHLAVFFVDNMYLQISKRVTSIKYIYTKKPQDHGLDFRTVGILMLVQIGIEILKYFYKSYKTYQARKIRKAKSPHRATSSAALDNFEDQKVEPTHTEEDVDGKMCPLCFDVRKNTACTPCGHLFCWECIVKNCLIKEECPQCRKIVKPSKIIQLRNY